MDTLYRINGDTTGSMDTLYRINGHTTGSMDTHIY